jgi:hypothetical protein
VLTELVPEAGEAALRVVGAGRGELVVTPFVVGPSVGMGVAVGVGVTFRLGVRVTDL